MNAADLRTLDYRLWRLRRLIAVSALLPLPGILFAELWGFGLTFAGGGGVLWLLWIAAAFGLAIRFPNGWMDHFALGLPLLAIIALSPIARLLGVGPVGGLLIGPLVLVAAWFVLSATLPLALDRIPLGRRKQSFVARVPLPPAELRAALFLRPNAQCGLHACGPADAEGVFEVRAFGYRMLDARLSAVESDIRFFAKVMESDETTQVTQLMMDRQDGTAGIEHQQITPARRGSLYVKEEVHDHFSLIAALGFWLNDVEADHFTATLDFVRGAPPRALKHMDQDSLLTWVGQRVMPLTDHNTEDAR